jgi:hypothetical protein
VLHELSLYSPPISLRYNSNGQDARPMTERCRFRFEDHAARHQAHEATTKEKP